MPVLLYALLFLGAWVLSVLLVPVVRRGAIRFGIVDAPGGRKIHDQPRALLGGIAIYLTFYAVVGLCLLLACLGPDGSRLLSWLPFRRELLLLRAYSGQLALVFLSSTIVMLLGLYDDVKGVHFSYVVKFAVQFCAACIVVAGGVKTRFMPLPVLNEAISVLWILGITNSFNLLDNMDGLSSGVALIAAAVLFLVVSGQGQVYSSMILVVYAGSLMGFLRYNFFPSRIFMGDTGSLFIGYLMAIFTITNSYVIPESSSLLPVIMPVLILSIPLFDTFSVIYLRLKEKRPVFVGDNSHFSHRLVRLGLSQRGAVLLIYTVSLCIGLGSMLLPSLSVEQSMVVLGQAVLIYLLITVLMIVGGKVPPGSGGPGEAEAPPAEREKP